MKETEENKLNNENNINEDWYETYYNFETNENFSAKFLKNFFILLHCIISLLAILCIASVVYIKTSNTEELQLQKIEELKIDQFIASRYPIDYGYVPEGEEEKDLSKIEHFDGVNYYRFINLFSSFEISKSIHFLTGIEIDNSYKKGEIGCTKRIAADYLGIEDENSIKDFSKIFNQTCYLFHQKVKITRISNENYKKLYANTYYTFDGSRYLTMSEDTFEEFIPYKNNNKTFKINNALNSKIRINNLLDDDSITMSKDAAEYLKFDKTNLIGQTKELNILCKNSSIIKNYKITSWNDDEEPLIEMNINNYKKLIKASDYFMSQEDLNYGYVINVVDKNKIPDVVHNLLDNNFNLDWTTTKYTIFQKDFNIKDEVHNEWAIYVGIILLFLDLPVIYEVIKYSYKNDKISNKDNKHTKHLLTFLISLIVVCVIGGFLSQLLINKITSPIYYVLPDYDFIFNVFNLNFYLLISAIFIFVDFILYFILYLLYNYHHLSDSND